jgi:hypothetical protein
LPTLSGDGARGTRLAFLPRAAQCIAEVGSVREQVHEHVQDGLSVGGSGWRDVLDELAEAGPSAEHDSLEQ